MVEAEPTPVRKPTGRPEDPSSYLPLTALAFHILLALAEEPRHGYGIILDIEERSGGAMRIRSGTLYTAIQRLEADGLLKESEKGPAGRSSDDERRRYYRITRLGRKVARLEADRLAAMLRTAAQRRVIEKPRSAG